MGNGGEWVSPPSPSLLPVPARSGRDNVAVIVLGEREAAERQKVERLDDISDVFFFLSFFLSLFFFCYFIVCGEER